MKEISKCLIVFAILSNVFCLDFGRFLGLRKRLPQLWVNPVNPQIIEIVRWRQPVCIVPGPQVPPCFQSLKKYQHEYERISAKGIEEKKTEESSKFEEDQRMENNKKTETSFYEENIKQDNFDEVSQETRSSMEILTPRIADYMHVENYESPKLESSKESSEDHRTMTLTSSTPGIENVRARRQGRYLVISTLSKTAIPQRTPPAISVTKVLNSPVTATLVANNCFPDIGVPLCNNYQETITIYKDPEVPHRPSDQQYVSFPENEQQVDHQVSHDHEQGESPDFWDDPNNPAFDNKPSRPHRPGLLAHVVNHIISKPGFLDSIPPGVINTVANNPAVLQAIANAGERRVFSSAGDVVTIQETEIKPLTYAIGETHPVQVLSTTTKPGLIHDLLEIKKPDILAHFGLNIFNKTGATTITPDIIGEQPNHPSSHPIASIAQSIGQHPIVQTIQNMVHKPEVVNTTQVELKPVLVIESSKKPGFFGNLWNAGKIGNDNEPLSTIGTNTNDARDETEDSDDETKDSNDEETKITPSIFVEEPEKPKISEILFKPENDISARPSLSDIFDRTFDNDQEREGKPTEAPGIFGGLFSNPSRPTGLDDKVQKTKTLFGFASSIFPKQQNRPIVIERPGAKPLLVEKPVYVQEKPPHPSGLLNFFIPSDNEPVLAVDHEVIKEPVYVFQKPDTTSGILNHVFGSDPSKPGFFQGFASLFSHQEAKPTEVAKEYSSTKTEKGSQKISNFRTVAEETETTIKEEGEESISTESTETEKVTVSSEEISEQKIVTTENTEKIDEFPKFLGNVTDQKFENLGEKVVTISKNSSDVSTSSNVENIPEKVVSDRNEEISEVIETPVGTNVDESVVAVETTEFPSTSENVSKVKDENDGSTINSENSEN